MIRVALIGAVICRGLVGWVVGVQSVRALVIGCRGLWGGHVVSGMALVQGSAFGLSTPRPRMCKVPAVS